MRVIDFADGFSSSSAPTLGQAMSVVAKTGTYTALQTDDLILCSGAAFTVTLPAAASSTGKVLKIQKTDSTWANVITIDGNGSETISGSLTTTLNTEGETVTLACNGTAWYILDRYIPSTETAYTPTCSWTANTTVTGKYRRIGSWIECETLVACSGAPTSANLTVNLPSGLTFDSARLINFDTNTSTGLDSSGYDGSAGYKLYTVYLSSTTVQASFQNSSGSTAVALAVTQAQPFTVGASDYFIIRFRGPITGWKS